MNIPADLIRRYCECGPTSRPAGTRHWPICRTCSRDRTRSGWSAASLTELRQRKWEHQSLEEIATAIGQPAQGCDIALNVLLGRTPIQALAVLERQAMRGFVMVRADDDEPLQAVAS